MINPILWVVLSFLLVSVSLTAVLVVLVPAVIELSRAARSFEKLCDTLDRDLPPTLESIRQTTAEIARLTDDVNAGVQNAGRVAQQVDQSVSSVRHQAQRAQVSTRSLMAGMGAAWTTLTQPAPPSDRRPHQSPTPPRPTAHPAARQRLQPPSSATSPTHPVAPAPAHGAADQAAAIASQTSVDISSPLEASDAVKSQSPDTQTSQETP